MASEMRFCVLTRIGSDRAGGAGGLLLSVPGAIGLSDIGLNELKPIYESARIKPAVVQVESHPYLPETELLGFCKEKGIVFLAFAPIEFRPDRG